MIPETNSSAGPSTDEPRRHVQIKSGSSVLIVEDDAAFMFILSEALGEEGFKVLAATNGTEALTLYRQHADKVSLAIVDVMLPGMDGLTVATEMRKINDDLFLLFMSGYDTEEIRGGVIGDIPNAQFFRKPFSFENMIKRIRDLS